MPPTDAYGKPVQSFVDANAAKQADYQSKLAAYNAAQPPAGTTSLNSPGGGMTGFGSFPPVTGGSTGQNFQNGAYSSNYLSSLPQGTQSALQSGQSVPLASLGNGSDAQGLGMLLGMNSQWFDMPGQQQAPAAAPQPTPPDTRQDYLDAASNPGPPTRVGANVPASQPLGVPSVMNAFMAAHPSGGAKGAGAYDNSGFFSTLSNLRNA